MTRWQYMVDALLIIIILVLLFFNVIGLFRTDTESDASFQLDRAAVPLPGYADQRAGPWALHAGMLPVQMQAICQIGLCDQDGTVTPWALIVFIVVMLVLFMVGGRK